VAAAPTTHKQAKKVAAATAADMPFPFPFPNAFASVAPNLLAAIRATVATVSFPRTAEAAEPGASTTKAKTGSGEKLAAAAAWRRRFCCPSFPAAAERTSISGDPPFASPPPSPFPPPYIDPWSPKTSPQITQFQQPKSQKPANG
jgi:hypothetical protein